LLFLLNLEFLPITFLVVYVGAIAVLFLFVLMMLNIKITEIKPDNAHFVPVAVLLTTVFVVEISLLTRLEFLPITFQLNHGLFISDLSNSIVNFVNSSLFAINESNMRSIGQVLFVDYWPQFIVVGYVLLFAMVGSIILTLHKTFVSKSQNVYFQTLRNFDKCIVMYS
jgi:NADH:ubiquinone oxidoreductase subunit 6 (subunit J)